MIKLFAVSILVLAHSWYDPECCSEKDCVEFTGTVASEGSGFRLMPNNVFVPKQNVRHSKDDKVHVCIPGDGRVRCLYLPVGA